MQRPRGQALVLFALLMLVVVMAAVATMSLSHLTQQKMEMQVANDTAAYSQAIAAARTYNSVALMNRAQVATMVALQGIHSAISFAGTYRGAINATMFAYEDDFNEEFGKCSRYDYQFNFTGSTNTGAGARNTCELIDRLAHEDSCERAHPFNLSIFGIQIRFDFACVGEACDARREVMGEYGFLALKCDMSLGASGGRVPLLKDEWCRVKQVWNTLDDMTGWQGRNAQAEAIALGVLEEQALRGTLPGALQPLATKSINVIGGTSVDVSAGQAHVSDNFAGGGSYNGLDAALGSRAHPFISRREDGARAIEEQLRAVVAASGAGPDEIQILGDFKGSSYFDEPAWGAARYSYSHGVRDPSAFASWADEHGRVSVSYNGARRNQREPGRADTRHIRNFRGSQSATDEQHVGDTHEWCPADLNAESSDPFVRHTLLPHKMPPPNEPDPCENTSCIWPGFYDVNATHVANAGRLFGQPKLLTVSTRNLSGSDPWNMFFNYKFTPSSAGAKIDFTANHAVKGVMPTMQSLASGLAYYHRPGHWKEHPNFFNPYWRATLVRSNIDGNGELRAKVAGANQDAVNALTGAGVNYLGIP